MAQVCLLNFPIVLAIPETDRAASEGGRGLNGAFADYTLIKSPSPSLHSTSSLVLSIYLPSILTNLYDRP